MARVDENARLDVVILDCSNYPQVVVVEETELTASQAKWEIVSMDGTRVFRHITITPGHGLDPAVLAVLNAFQGVRQMERGLESILSTLFEAGRKFEREYPNGKGSMTDPAVQQSVREARQRAASSGTAPSQEATSDSSGERQTRDVGGIC